MYYFKFDAMGMQEQMVFADETPGEGWFEWDDEIDGHLFKLVDSQVTPMEQEEKDSYTNRLFESSVLSATRAERNKRLMESDWTQLGLGNLSDAKRAEWETYRQALRDMMSGITDFMNIEFPKAPN
jgi:hypothetical protein